MLAVPTPALDEVLAELGDALDGKVVVDVTNWMDPNDPARSWTAPPTPSTSRVASPGARVVKAFNTALAAKQADPVVDGVQLDGFVAGDDQAAKRQVLELVGSIGFRPIDAGIGIYRALRSPWTHPQPFSASGQDKLPPARDLSDQ